LPRSARRRRPRRSPHQVLLAYRPKRDISQGLQAPPDQHGIARSGV
jgi:hypothetical protein